LNDQVIEDEGAGLLSNRQKGKIAGRDSFPSVKAAEKTRFKAKK